MVASLRRMAVRAEALDDPASVAAAWRSMAESAGNAFLTPEWFGAWREHYGGDSDAVVVRVRDADDPARVVGLLPFTHRGREVRFAGHNVGDLFAPLAAPGLEDEVVRSAAGVVADVVGGRRSRLVLDNVERGAPWLRAFADAWPGRLATTEVLTSVVPRLGLGGRSWEDVLASRSRNFRSQWGRRHRAMEREHDLVFRLADDPARLRADMATFFALHTARWSSRGGSSSAGPRVRAFHTDWAGRALERGWLRLWFLELDGVPVAAFYGWLIGGRYAYYLAGFDPAHAPKSPGLVLLAHTIRHAIEEGAQVYDLLLGDEPYKQRFADQNLPVATVVMAGTRDPATWRAVGTSGIRSVAGHVPDGLRSRARTAVRAAGVTLPGARRR
jgi:CelD/BcsL family acetyltransferase involved in cellulose biosynthesis